MVDSLELEDVDLPSGPPNPYTDVIASMTKREDGGKAKVLTLRRAEGASVEDFAKVVNAALRKLAESGETVDPKVTVRKDVIERTDDLAKIRFFTTNRIIRGENAPAATPAAEPAAESVEAPASKPSARK